MTWKTSDIKWLDCEISSLCNAGCVDCNRWIFNKQTQQMELNSYNKHIDQFVDVDVFVKRIKKFQPLKFLLLQGNVGDPLTHPHISDIVEKVFEIMPDVRIEINTNGSVGALKSWQKLCTHAQKNVSLIFSIDGLEDTNHIYRRGCDWNKIMRNCKLWIDAGGHAEWKMINFPYNAHQREEAKKLSEQLGFALFQIRNRISPYDDADRFIENQADKPVLKIKFDQSSVTQHTEKEKDELIWEHVKDWKIDPSCTYTDSDSWDHWPNFHMNVEGTLWPCCFTSNLPYIESYQREIWNTLDKKYTQKYGEHWNNLDYRTVEQIISTDWFQKDLPNSWKKRQDNTFLMCYTNCGACEKSYVWNEPDMPLTRS